MCFVIGIDVGFSSVKTVLMKAEGCELIQKNRTAIRRCDPKAVVQKSYERILFKAQLRPQDIAYVASTGEGGLVDFRTGHFYSMTTHARGAIYLDSAVRSVVDVGALHSKVMVIDSRSKVERYRMTSQCASGSGQFLENISRYLGVRLDEISQISLEADRPEVVSNVCAVLAETDVINMISRKVSLNNILQGVHLSIAERLVNLVRLLKTSGRAMITGSLGENEGLIKAMQSIANKERLDVTFTGHELSAYAGCIGAALWGGFRHHRLKNQRNQD